MGLKVDERPLDPATLKFSTEAFLTSSLRGIAPLVQLDGVAIGTGKPGTLTRQVMTAYAELVARECGA
jgi:branched-subunit amino acid aminotransferase/4-amino-4-deoxychorismate lyase